MTKARYIYSDKVFQPHPLQPAPERHRGVLHQVLLAEAAFVCQGTCLPVACDAGSKGDEEAQALEKIKCACGGDLYGGSRYLVNLNQGRSAVSDDIIKEIFRASIWKTPSVSEEPEIVLERWRVLEVENEQGQVQRHFVGYSTYGWEGRASTPIQEFNPAAGQGVTRSGRLYQLTGRPGYDPDGAWVWCHWSRANKLVNQRDVSEEYWAAMVQANPDLDHIPEAGDR